MAICATCRHKGMECYPFSATQCSGYDNGLKKQRQEPVTTIVVKVDDRRNCPFWDDDDYTCTFTDRGCDPALDEVDPACLLNSQSILVKLED